MPKTVLVADDSVTIQKVVNLTFADEDVVIESVSNGDQAVETARRLKPHVVLADVCMPGRNGYEVCESIKKDPELSRTPVVLLVGTFEPFDEKEASRVKCDAYLTKPFESSELIRLVQSLIKDRSRVSPNPDEALRVPPLVAAKVAAGESHLISPRTRESFLGSNKILDLFDGRIFERPAPGASARVRSESVSAVPGGTSPDTSPPSTTARAGSTVDSHATGASSRPSEGRQIIPFPGVRELPSESLPPGLSEEVMAAIVDRVVRRISQEAVREIAWEVVPELAEILIRQYLSERRSAGEI